MCIQVTKGLSSIGLKLKPCALNSNMYKYLSLYFSQISAC